LNPVLKSIFAWVAILAVVVMVAFMYFDAQTRKTQVAYSEFLDRVESGEVQGVLIRGKEIQISTRDSAAKLTTHAPDLEGLVAKLREKQVTIDSREPAGTGLLDKVIFLLPFVILIGLWVVFMRQMQGAGTKAMSFGKSRARLLSSHQKKATFKDVAGCDEAKEELQEIIEFLKDPQKFAKLGGKIPKGVLLVGQPGTGKTLLARAIAGEANVPFFSLSGSDFVEMFVGVGASRVRDLFEQGKKNAPCIIFIDEIDAVGRHRGAGLGGGHDEREQTLNALLVEMDGFETTEGVIIIAATNRPDVLDPALLRPGRFDRRVVVGLPDIRGREGILQVHTRKIPLADDVNLEIIARGTPGFSGADLANLVNEAALGAARKSQKVVLQADLDEARDKVIMGLARRSMIISDREKRVTAWHEAGHALTAALLPETQPVHKVTIIPHAMALGVTQFLPQDDRHTRTLTELEAQLAVGMGGRAAEHVAFGELTTGAADDIKRATDTARRMVSIWGMSPAIGPLGFAERDENVFLGRDFGRPADYSERTAEEIDAEVKRIVEKAWSRAVSVLTANRATLDRVATALLERETLNAQELRLLLEGQPLPPLPRPRLNQPVAEPQPAAVAEPARATPPLVPAAGDAAPRSPLRQADGADVDRLSRR
jgi:cell division protease FtsH